MEEARFDPKENEQISEFNLEFNKLTDESDKDEGMFHNHDFESSFKKLKPPKETEDRIMLYFTDEKGYIKVWDLSFALTNKYVKKVDCYYETRHSYNPKRKEKINAANIASSHLMMAKTIHLPQMLDAKQCVECTAVKAHSK